MWKTYKNYKFYTTLPDKPVWDADMDYWLNGLTSVLGNNKYVAVPVGMGSFKVSGVICR